MARGAVLVAQHDLELPACYGADEAAAVAAEYRAAREDAALVDLAERGALDVSGPLRQKFLHGILSNDVAGRAPGQGCQAALMDVKGHLQAFLRVLVQSDAVRLELTRARLEPVEALLLHYRVAAPVRFARPDVAPLGLLGPRAGELLAALGAAVPGASAEEHVRATLAGHDVLVARAGDLPCAGFVLHTPSAGAAEVWDALAAAGARPLGRRALDALRVEQGLPWYGCDVGEEHLLHETGLVRVMHSPSKGCYVGQEVIARLEARGGNVNKALRGLRLGAHAAPGDAISADDHEVGRVTTAALSPRLGPLAMGYVHRNHFAPGTSLTVAGHPASVALLPLDGEGAA